VQTLWQDQNLALPDTSETFRYNSAGLLTRIGDMLLRPLAGAKPPRDVDASGWVRYTREASQALSFLVRLAELGAVGIFQGEPGSLKTTLLDHFSQITGRKLNKHNVHKGSESSHFTIDVEQTEDGTLVHSLISTVGFL